MKKTHFLFIIILIAILSLLGCSTQKTIDYTAKQIAQKLKGAGLPITNIIVYTEKTDLNELLGKPGEYISKANFADTTITQGEDLTDPTGGTIETFLNPTDLQKRKVYIERVFMTFPQSKQYIYVNGNYLLRIENKLTLADAAKYEKAFKAIKK